MWNTSSSPKETEGVLVAIKATINDSDIEKTIIYSNYSSNDISHAIYVIADEEPPTQTLSPAPNREAENGGDGGSGDERKNGSPGRDFQDDADDSGSGVGDIYDSCGEGGSVSGDGEDCSFTVTDMEVSSSTAKQL